MKKLTLTLRVAGASRVALAAALALWAAGCRHESPAAKQQTESAGAAVAAATPREPEAGPVEPVTDADRPDPEALVKAYNARDFGSPGWRRVALDLVNDSRVTRSFTVVNLWEGRGDEVRTLFYLEEPRGLQGTSYLLSEGGAGASAQDIKVHLFLPAGERRVLEIAPNDLDEGLLGSDFTYRDLRMRLPVRGYSYRLAGQSSLAKRPAWVVEAAPSAPETASASAWGRARFYLAREFPFLLGADYFERTKAGDTSASTPHLVRRMRVESLEQRGTVWTATRMTMYGGERRSSVLTLRDARFKLEAFESQLLTPDSLPSLPPLLRRHNWTPGEPQTPQP